jgi:anti-anti-sigma factor
MTDDARRRRPPPGDKPRGGGSRAAGPDVAPGGGNPSVIDQVFDAGSLYALRSAVAAHAADAGLPEGRIEDLVLAVHELAANAARHGAGQGRLRAWRTDSSLCCEVSDGGAPWAAGAGQGGTESGDAGWRVESRHGLWLIRQVADRTSWRTGPSGTVVAAVSFTLGPPGQLAPFHSTQRFRDGCTVLAVTGQLDLNSANQLADTVADLIAATPALRLILDVTGLTRWDSTGLAALITAQQRVSAIPAARMVLAGLPGQLLGRLRDGGLAGRFTLADSIADARDSFPPPT